jgi:hypothetical protein
MEETKPKPFAFILMPFGQDFEEIYKLGIKEACTNAGAYCERVDEQIFVGNILERIYNQIAKADIVISDMTGRNPNVFYETGYAHAINKQVILLTQDASDIPFDLKQYPHIVYGGKILPLREQLEPKIRWCIENPKEFLAHVDLNLDLYVDRVPLIENPTIVSSGHGSSWLQIDIHNTTTSVLNQGAFRLAIILPAHLKITYPENIPGVRLSDGRLLFNLESNHVLFPDGWATIECLVGMGEDWLKEKGDQLGLRIFTEVGPKDYQFRLVLKE